VSIKRKKTVFRSRKVEIVPSFSKLAYWLKNQDKPSSFQPVAAVRPEIFVDTGTHPALLVSYEPSASVVVKELRNSLNLKNCS